MAVAFQMIAAHVLYFGGPDDAVYIYLHEHGPRHEQYAASSSLALWRLVHEQP